MEGIFVPVLVAASGALNAKEAPLSASGKSTWEPDAGSGAGMLGDTLGVDRWQRAVMEKTI
jgi:hypothetical protein